MAIFEEPTEEDRAIYMKWVAERPDNVRAIAEKFEPWRLYRLKTSGHRVLIYSLDEMSDGSVTLTVAVLGKYNAVTFERKVFGINPEDLEECDLPGPDEKLGAKYTKKEDVEAHIEEMRKALGFSGMTPDGHTGG